MSFLLTKIRARPEHNYTVLYWHSMYYFYKNKAPCSFKSLGNGRHWSMKTKREYSLSRSLGYLISNLIYNHILWKKKMYTYNGNIFNLSILQLPQNHQIHKSNLDIIVKTLKTLTPLCSKLKKKNQCCPSNLQKHLYYVSLT